MKIRSIFFAASAALVLSACGNKAGDVTEITGTVVPEGISEVKVTLAETVDTLVPVVDGKFAISLPANLTASARIQAGNYRASFLSDGTPLTIVVDEKTTVTSAYPEVSAQEKLNLYNAAEAELMEEYSNTQREIMADSLLTDDEKNAKFEEFYNSFIDGYLNHHIEAAKANTENFVSVIALSNLRGMAEDSQMDSLINNLAPALQEAEYVKDMKKAIEARLNTAEGKPFVDFTVNTVVGMTRSIPPQPKYSEVKFSDYVGKGKYILVDFWAPWCGPCKREVPNLKKIHDKYAGEDFDILSIAVWERADVKVTLDTAAELGMDWLHINSAGSIPTDIYGIEGIPHIMLVGPDGTILKRDLRGEAIGEEIAKYIQK